jgi:UDP-3-O-[3-hydroxymyristoyl] glucosamine N-acyltransferase
MYNVEDLLESVSASYEAIGRQGPVRFARVSTSSDADSTSLIFFARPNAGALEELGSVTPALALVERSWGVENLGELEQLPYPVFLVEHPRLVIARLLHQMQPSSSSGGGVHPTAVVHPEADIHSSVEIGAYAVVGRCHIGWGSAVGAHSVIHDGAEIGNNVMIREHCSIGGAGFGFVRDENDRLVHFPHVGKVVIEDGVEVFPFANVDRGSLGETRVRRGSKVDHYAHISHNCEVGEDTIVTAGTVMCGGSRLGSRVWSGIGSIVKEKTVVGDGATLGLGAVVLKHVDEGAVVAGVPAKPLNRTKG